MINCIKYYFLLFPAFISCQQRSDNALDNSKLTKAIERAVEWLPANYTEIYKTDTFSMPNNNLGLFYDVIQNDKDDQLVMIDKLISKDLNMCLDTLFRLSKNGSIISPEKTNYVKHEQWYVYSRTYKLVKTKAEAFIGVLYKNENEYYTFHFSDCSGIDCSILTLQTSNVPTVFGQIRRGDDCFRNYRITLTDSINNFTITKCVDEMKPAKKQYLLDSLLN